MARALLLSLTMIGAWSTAPLARAQSSNVEAKTIVVALLLRISRDVNAWFALM